MKFKVLTLSTVASVALLLSACGETPKSNTNMSNANKVTNASPAVNASPSTNASPASNASPAANTNASANKSAANAEKKEEKPMANANTEKKDDASKDH